MEILFKILRLDEFKGISERIDIAKGKHELKTSLKEAFKQQKRFDYER